MSDKQLHWSEKLGLITGVVGALAAVLALLAIPQLDPFFKVLKRGVPLWIVFLIVIVAICLPGIVHRFWSSKPGQNAEQPKEQEPTEEQLKKRCNLTIKDATRIPEQERNQYMLSGGYDQWPPEGYGVWLITADVGGGKKYWPQQEIIRGASNMWHARIGLGQAKVVGERMIAILAIVGECGQILFNYHLKTKDANNTERRLPLSELPGVIQCADRILDKLIER